MLGRVLALALVAIALAAPHASAVPLDLAQPVGAIAIIEPNQSYVAWVPGPVTPDYYNVYGISNGTSTLLVQVQGANDALLNVQYPAYAVTAVVGGVESSPTGAVVLVEECVQIIFEFPFVVLGSGCEFGVGTGVGSKAYVSLDLPRLLS